MLVYAPYCKLLIYSAGGGVRRLVQFLNIPYKSQPHPCIIYVASIGGATDNDVQFSNMLPYIAPPSRFFIGSIDGAAVKDTHPLNMPSYDSLELISLDMAGSSGESVKAAQLLNMY